MNLKLSKILPAFVCGIAIGFSPVLRAQTPAPSISQAPEVGQGTSTSTVASTPAAGEHGRGKGMEKLAQALGLTPQQRESLRPILQQRHAQMMAIRKESLPEPQKMAQIKAVRKASNAQIKNILTPEQLRKLMVFMKEHRREHPQQS